MKKEKLETPSVVPEHIKSDVKPLRVEAPNQRPKPTPKPPKKEK